MIRVSGVRVSSGVTFCLETAGSSPVGEAEALRVVRMRRSECDTGEPNKGGDVRLRGYVPEYRFPATKNGVEPIAVDRSRSSLPGPTGIRPASVISDRDLPVQRFRFKAWR